jgi:hypothetical protein
MEPLDSFQQRLYLTGEIARIESVTFILATGWAPSPFPQFCGQAKTKGWRTVAMECGHDVMLDLPGKLTRELLAASARCAASAH